MTRRNTQREGFSSILVIAVVILVVGGGAYLYSQGSLTLPTMQQKVTAVPTNIPVEARTNPGPSSSNTITVGEVMPGRTVKVENVELAQDGYIAVISDMGVNLGAVLGKSSHLKAGSHSNISISVSSNLVDGSVILVRLQNAQGADIEGEGGFKIEVQKNVGMTMGHYDNEY